MWPQIVYLIITAMGVGLALARHGKPKEGKDNFWVSLIATSAVWYLLYVGHFFDVFFK